MSFQGGGGPSSGGPKTGDGNGGRAESGRSSPRSEEFIGNLRIRGEITQLKFGRLRATTEDGQMWMKRGDEAWTPVKKPELPPPPRPGEDEGLQLFLSMQRQGQGEPDHWSLFLARSGQRGEVFQVKGKRVDASVGVAFAASQYGIRVEIYGVHPECC